MSAELRPPAPNNAGRRFLVGCFGVALLIAAILALYIVVGHREAVGPYREPPAARP